MSKRDKSYTLPQLEKRSRSKVGTVTQTPNKSSMMLMKVHRSVLSPRVQKFNRTMIFN
jgi:hypothetical protein